MIFPEKKQAHGRASQIVMATALILGSSIASSFAAAAPALPETPASLDISTLQTSLKKLGIEGADYYPAELRKPAEGLKPVPVDSPPKPSSKTAMPAVDATKTDAAPQGPGQARIELRSRIKLTSENITLADIATIESEDYLLRQRLSELDLGAGPTVDTPTRLPRIRIERAIALMTREDESVDLTGAGETLVERASMRVDMEKLRDEIVDRLKAEAPFDATKLTFTDLQLPDEILLPKGGLKLITTFQFGNRWLGQINYTADFQVEGKLAKRVSGVVKADMDSKVLQALRPIAQGEALHADDFREIDWPQSRVPRNALTEIPSGPAGAKARGSIRPGDILTSDAVTRPAVVNRNDAISLVITKGPLKASATALAKESGGVGDVIRTINLNSKKEIYARIIDSQSAEVVY